jgi:hypothetical protein
VNDRGATTATGTGDALALSPRRVDDVRVDGRPEEVAMEASVGDHITVRGHRVGEPDRDCEVTEVRGPHGEPPFVVRWGSDGHETLFFPGPDAVIGHPGGDRLT